MCELEFMSLWRTRWPGEAELFLGGFSDIVRTAIQIDITTLYHSTVHYAGTRRRKQLHNAPTIVKYQGQVAFRAATQEFPICATWLTSAIFRELRLEQRGEYRLLYRPNVLLMKLYCVNNHVQHSWRFIHGRCKRCERDYGPKSDYISRTIQMKSSHFTWNVCTIRATLLIAQCWEVP